MSTTSFPRTLSLLRKEKGISQKSAAAELGVSQALLSHYEKGVREPGLSFVVQAADFYSVSVDFLLGRTMSRDGTGINVEQLYDEAESNDNRLRGSAMSLFCKKILVNTIGILFDLLGKAEDRSLVKEAYSCLSVCLYKLFRYLYTETGANPEVFFSVAGAEFPDGSDAQFKLSEMRYKKSCRGGKSDVKISNDSLTRDYPLLYQSLLSLIHATEKDVKGITDSSEA